MPDIIFRFPLPVENPDNSSAAWVPSILERIRPDDNGEYDEDNAEFMGPNMLTTEDWEMVRQYHTERANLHATLAAVATRMKEPQ